MEMEMSTNGIRQIAFPVLLLLGVTFAVACASGGESEETLSPTATIEPTAEPIRAVPTIVPGASTTETVAVYNGLLITATGEEPIRDGVVVISGGVIAAIGNKEEVDIPVDATLVDANGGAILPGLIDAHTHILNDLTVEAGELDNFDRIFHLNRPLKAGVTTIRDLGSHWGLSENISDLRAALEKAGNTIPNVVLTGPLLAASGGWAVTEFSNQASAIENAEAAREITERLIAAGVDQIKILSDFNPDQPAPALTPEQVQALSEAAHSHGILVTIHASTSDAAMAVSNGVDQLAHWPIGPELPGELIEQLVAAGIPVVATFNISPAAAGDVRRFLDTGGTLVFGTDGPGTGPVNEPYREMELMSLAGMTPMEIIMAATANAADAVGLGEQVGTLAVGKMADIIVVDGNPLDDLAVFRDGVIVVIKGGEIVPLDS